MMIRRFPVLHNGDARHAPHSKPGITLSIACGDLTVEAFVKQFIEACKSDHVGYTSTDTMQSPAKQHDATCEVAVDPADLRDSQASQNGDEHAYERIVRRYQQEIAKRLWRFTRDQQVLEELVQETFVQAWRSLHTYRDDAPLNHWLTRIATRVGYRHWKTCLKQRQLSQSLPEAPVMQTSESNENANENAEYVHALLDQLPPRDRMILTLTYLEECTVKKIAQQTGWSTVMVKVQAHRARNKLKMLIEKLE